MKLLRGDNIEHLKTMFEGTVDCVITDPPYGLSFMGKKWDYDVPSVEFWKNVFRVLKPGAHVLSFGGTRTYHRMVCNMEDAGFEIRDQIQWLYGSGFPKSHNLKEEWQGWGSALKPANEPIVLARKPLAEPTLAKNVLKYGTGAININECRIAGEPTHGSGKVATKGLYELGHKDAPRKGGVPNIINTQGRWPANVILDEEAGEMLDEQSGLLKTNSGKYKEDKEKAGSIILEKENKAGYITSTGDSGGASRFFYCAKSSKRERGDGNVHPTVKPIKLMEYLCKLITPPNGTILDPFMGSGTTGIAAKNLGFNFIGIELDKDYFEIASKRIETAKPIICQTEDEDQTELAL